MRGPSKTNSTAQSAFYRAFVALSPLMTQACVEDSDCRHTATCPLATASSSVGAQNIAGAPNTGGVPNTGGTFPSAGGTPVAGGTSPAGGTPSSGSTTSVVTDAGTPDLPRSLADAAGGENGTGGRQPACGLGGGIQECAPPTPVCGAMGCVTCLSDQGCAAPVPYCAQGVTERGNRCVECLANPDCTTDKPYCINNQCVACQAGVAGQPGTGCGANLTCKAGATPPENTCVGCIDNNQCGGGVCINQTCIPCDPTDDQGCGVPEGRCLAGPSSGANRCVACLEHPDCGNACQENACVPCSTADNEGCTSQAPQCKAGTTNAENECVECLTDNQCPGGICEDNTCMPCDDSDDRGCDGDTPECKPGNTDKQNRCVECVDNGHCHESNKNICHNDECVGCRDQNDCQSASKSKCGNALTCEKCEENSDCSHIDGKNVCDTSSGECVECTGTDYDDCGTNAGGKQLVCNSLEQSCTDLVERESGFCTECVTDAQCMPGQFCVETELQGESAGRYCLWEQGNNAPGAPASCLSNGRPTSGTANNVVSIDGNKGTMCVPAATTCAALEDYKSKSCDPGESAADRCGTPGIDDSVCALAQQNPVEHRCSNICLSNEDCYSGSTCPSSGNPKSCSF